MTIAPSLKDRAALFHALSDETRLAIVERLRTGERCVCDLTDTLDAAQSRLSFHLKVLRESGLVDCRREGRWAYYWLRPEAFDLIDVASKALRPTPAAITAQKAKCCA
jgi:ArsR family transcriptional regulator